MIAQHQCVTPWNASTSVNKDVSVQGVGPPCGTNTMIDIGVRSLVAGPVLAASPCTNAVSTNGVHGYQVGPTSIIEYGIVPWCA